MKKSIEYQLAKIFSDLDKTKNALGKEELTKQRKQIFKCIENNNVNYIVDEKIRAKLLSGELKLISHVEYEAELLRLRQETRKKYSDGNYTVSEAVG